MKRAIKEEGGDFHGGRPAHGATSTPLSPHTAHYSRAQGLPRLGSLSPPHTARHPQQHTAQYMHDLRIPRDTKGYQLES